MSDKTVTTKHPAVSIYALCDVRNLKKLEKYPVKVKQVAKRMRKVAAELDKIAMFLERVK